MYQVMRLLDYAIVLLKISRGTILLSKSTPLYNSIKRVLFSLVILVKTCYFYYFDSQTIQHKGMFQWFQLHLSDEYRCYIFNICLLVALAKFVSRI